MPTSGCKGYGVSSSEQGLRHRWLAGSLGTHAKKRPVADNDRETSLLSAFATQGSRLARHLA